jgi:hypothetical protein
MPTLKLVDGVKVTVSCDPKGEILIVSKKISIKCIHGDDGLVTVEPSPNGDMKWNIGTVCFDDIIIRNSAVHFASQDCLDTKELTITAGYESYVDISSFHGYAVLIRMKCRSTCLMREGTVQIIQADIENQCSLNFTKTVCKSAEIMASLQSRIGGGLRITSDVNARSLTYSSISVIRDSPYVAGIYSKDETSQITKN